jgi:integrase
LTTKQVEAAVGKNSSYGDGDGLFLKVRGGSAIWFLRVMKAGKLQEIRIGDGRRDSLATVRTLAAEVRNAVKHEGRDILHERRIAKLTSSVAAANSFKSVGDEYLDKRMSGRAAVTVDKARWCLALLEPIHSRPIADIMPAELLAVLRVIEGRGHRETARRTRSIASQIFRYGIATARCTADPAQLLSGALETPVVTHMAAITNPKLLGEFLRDIATYKGMGTVGTAIRLIPHVALRPSELRLATWQEIDWEESVWHIPAARTKLRRPHDVPLSTQVVAMLRNMAALTDSGPNSFIFPAVGKFDRPLSENSLNQAYRRLGYDTKTVTAHGFRATFSTLANESGKWQPDAIERALAHGASNAVRGIYSRGTYWDERVQMAQWWSDYLDTLKTGAIVVPFDTRRSVS